MRALRGGAATHATTETMKEAAPMSSPMARDPEPCERAAKVEKTSGEPLEKARKVTPACANGERDNKRAVSDVPCAAADPIANRCSYTRWLQHIAERAELDSEGELTTLSLMPKRLAMVLKLGQKKSEAVMPTKAKRNMSHKIMPANKKGRCWLVAPS
jgi:hypothetical protein